MNRDIAMCRRVVVSILAVGVAALAAGWNAAGAQQPLGKAPQASRFTSDDLDTWMTKLSNWGRWGADDQIGAARLMTPAKRKQAAALVKEGVTVSMARRLPASPGSAVVDGGHPFSNRAIFNDPAEAVMEVQNIFFHGGAFTHLDALCHVSYKGKVYNGLVLKEIVTVEKGCTKMGVMAVADGIVSRAVLIDIARFRGVSSLESGTHVYREDIEAWEKRAKVKISPGDVILLRTGRALNGGSGFDGSVIPFLKERDVALIGSDGVQDVGPYPPGVNLPIHRFAIVALGAHLIDNMDLEAVADTAARLNRWEFLFTASPIPVMNGTGSIINPIAVF